MSIQVLYTKDQIANRVKEIADVISEKYSGEKLTLVGVLNGGMPFLTDLMRAVDPKLDIEIDTIDVSSYHGGLKTSGVVAFHKGLTNPERIKDRYIILVDDAVFSGHTLAKIREVFQGESLGCECACVVSDSSNRQVDIPRPEYVGFESPPGKHLVGYGMDAGYRYRTLPDICIYTPPMKERVGELKTAQQAERAPASPAKSAEILRSK